MARVKRVAQNEDSVFVKRFKELITETAPLQDIADKLSEDGYTVTRQSISNWLAGETLPQTSQLIRISKTFGVSVDWLLGISDVRTTNAELQAICEYTGLNENAVEVLHDLKNDPDEKDLIKVLDFMLSDYEQLGIGGKFYSLLGLTWEYLFAEYFIPNNPNAQYVEYRIKGHGDITRSPIERLKDMILPEITQKLMNTKDKFFEERCNKIDSLSEHREQKGT